MSEWRVEHLDVAGSAPRSVTINLKIEAFQSGAINVSLRLMFKDTEHTQKMFSCLSRSFRKKRKFFLKILLLL